MIKSVTITNHLGDSVKIDLFDGDPEHGMIIQNISGLGPPKANVNMTDLVTMDGSLINSSRVEKRNIIINMIFTPALTIEDTRQRTYKYFPIKKQVRMVIETDNRTIETVGIVESNEPDIFSKQESNQISLICGDPYFYSEDDNTTIFSDVEPTFEFEFLDEFQNSPTLEFGIINDIAEKTIYYDGDGDVGITITIHDRRGVGRRTGNIMIYKTETREMMKIDTEKIIFSAGPGMVAGDDIIITTTRGNKRIGLVRVGRYTNILNALDKNSDWLQLTKGKNTFAILADFGTEDLDITIENKIAYGGV